MCECVCECKCVCECVSVCVCVFTIGLEQMKEHAL